MVRQLTDLAPTSRQTRSLLKQKKGRLFFLCQLSALAFELSADVSSFSISWTCSPNWQAFFIHVEMPSFGRIYTWSKIQTATTPSITNILDILYPLSQRLGRLTLKKIPEMACTKMVQRPLHLGG